MVHKTNKQSSFVSCPGARITPANPFSKFSRDDIEQSIPSRFQQIVKRYPSRIAVKVDQGAITYGTLNKMANRIAHALRSHSGSGSESVALLVKNDARTIAAILGIMKAGKIYVPLDVRFHPLGQSSFFEIPTPKFCSLEATDRMAKSWLDSAHVLIDFESLGNGLSDCDPEDMVSPDALSQILYTSGTTGHPKGVMDNHRNMLHYVMRLGNASKFHQTIG